MVSLIPFSYSALPWKLMKIRKQYNFGTSPSRADTLGRAIDCTSRGACGWSAAHPWQPMREGPFVFALRFFFCAFSGAKSGLVVRLSDTSKRICCFDWNWWSKACLSHILNVVNSALPRRNARVKTTPFGALHLAGVRRKEERGGGGRGAWRDKMRNISFEDVPQKNFFEDWVITALDFLT